MAEKDYRVFQKVTAYIPVDLKATSIADAIRQVDEYGIGEFQWDEEQTDEARPVTEWTCRDEETGEHYYWCEIEEVWTTREGKKDG